VEKILFLGPVINAFDTYEASLYLSISLENANTIKSISVYTLVDFDTTGIFINQSFVERHHLNTHKLS